MSTPLITPRIAITLGDPAGIGPETVVGAWHDPRIHEFCRPLVVGHPELVARAVRLLGIAARVVSIQDPAEARPAVDVIPCLTAVSDDVLDITPGTIDARGGRRHSTRCAPPRSWRSKARSTRSRLGRCTKGPCHGGPQVPRPHRAAGRAVRREGLRHDALPRAGRTRAWPAGLAIVHVTLHMALREVFAVLDREAVLQKTRLVARFMAELKGSAPRVGVCCAQPARGRGGLFGDEEQTIIAPAVARRRGRRASMPRDRCRPTRSLAAPATASSTRSWPCITTRGTSRSSCWPCTAR